MKKLLKITGYSIVILIVAATIGFFILDEEIPSMKEGIKADALAYKMEESLNKAAFDSTRYFAWNFIGNHQYYWDKTENKVLVVWGDHEVLLNLNHLNQSSVKQNGAILVDENKSELIEKAWKYYCNDSFWLIAPYKSFDAGVSRGMVQNEDGSESLLVQYSSGGATPGDSYLWHLDENNRPNSFQMWVSIIPVGGIEASWEDWEEMNGGFYISTKHNLGIISFGINDLKAGQTIESIGISANKMNF